MERIHRRTPLESEALARLLSALAVSLALHAAIVWLAPGPAYSGWVNAFQVRIDLPFATISEASPLSIVVTESSLPVRGKVGARRRGFQLQDTIDSTYFPTSELDVFPAPRVPIRLPDNFFVSEGVRVLAKIDASGRVTETQIFDSDAAGSENVAAMNAIMRTPFQAAQRNGCKVRSEIVIEVASR